MIQFFVRVSMVLLVTVCVSVPATAASVQELQRQLNGLNNRMTRMENQMRALLDILKRLHSLQSEIQLLRGDSERALHEIQLVKERQRQLYMDIDQRLQTLDGGPVAKSESRKPASQGADFEPVEASGVSGADSQYDKSFQTTESRAQEQQDYKHALTLVKERRYEDAVRAFSAFLSDYPQSESADNAQYWLAEANYGSRNYADALVGFKKVIDNYPQSSKIPGSTLKLGFSYYELAQWDQARKVLTSLKDDYPNTSAARLAEERLRRMKREGH
jgi:tol-pal system protein YbgF